MERAYFHRSEVRHDHLMLLHGHLAGADARALGPDDCLRLAAELGLPFEAVRFPAAFCLYCS